MKNQCPQECMEHNDGTAMHISCLVWAFMEEQNDLTHQR
jgi:hypothetical protein